MITWSSVRSSSGGVPPEGTAGAAAAGAGTSCASVAPGLIAAARVGSAGPSKRPRLTAAIIVRCCCSIKPPIHFSSMPLLSCSAYEVFFKARISPPTYTSDSMYGFARPLSSVWTW